MPGNRYFETIVFETIVWAPLKARLFASSAAGVCFRSGCVRATACYRYGRSLIVDRDAEGGVGPNSIN